MSTVRLDGDDIIIEVRQGTTLGPIVLAWQDPTGTPVPLTGLNWRIQARQGTQAFSADSGNATGTGVITLNRPAGEVTFTIPPAVTATWALGMPWDGELYDPLNPVIVHAFGAGRIDVTPNVV